jgi:folate-dependent phosphoribosylglycinamide formyltransferase PurN
MVYRFSAFSTFRDIDAQNLFINIAKDINRGFISANLAYIFCSREYGENKNTDEYVNATEQYFREVGLDSEIIRFSAKKFKPDLKKKARKAKDTNLMDKIRDEYYEEAMDLLEEKGYSARKTPVFMIGHMEIIPDNTVSKYTMINLHPATPPGPIGKWEDVMWENIEKRVKAVGGMIHIATKDMDRGPVLTYYEFPVSEECKNLWEVLDSRTESLQEIKEKEYKSNPLFKRVRLEQYIREGSLIAVTIKKLGDKVLEIRDREVYAFGEKTKGICVNEEIQYYLNNS